MDSIEKAKDTTLPKLIFSLGIPNVGLSNAKLITKAFNDDLDAIIKADASDLSMIDGIGEVIGESVYSYFNDERNLANVNELIMHLRMRREDAADENSELNGKTLVVTGSLNLYKNRKDLEAEIEKKGGHVSGSVSKNTFILINNDIMSASSKNKTAKELGVPIMSEEDFVNKYLR